MEEDDDVWLKAAVWVAIGGAFLGAIGMFMALTY
jgi:hypothetical protein